MNKNPHLQLILTFLGVVAIKALEDYFHYDLVYPFTSGLVINYLLNN